MKRSVLEIPLEEIKLQFETNIRQDIKVVAPSILSPELFEKLSKKGIKRENPLTGSRWNRSFKTKPNNICEAKDFDYDSNISKKGPFTISFANEKAEQEEHYHKQHTEIYYSEHPIKGSYKILDNSKETSEEISIELNQGGAIVFNPNVLHYIELSGLCFVIEIPAVENDRFVE